MKFEILAMLKRGGGVIVNNSSVDGLRAYPFPVGSAPELKAWVAAPNCA